MKTALRLSVATLGLALLVPSVKGQDFPYTGTITITGYTGPGGDVVIPDSVNGLTVIAIGNWAFYNCSNVTSVTIPETVTSIGYAAFQGCIRLANVTMGNTLTNIGDWAFYYCQSLTNVTIPNTVKNIGNSAFSGCTSLTSVTMGDSLVTIGNAAFSRCTSLITLNMGKHVTTIGLLAFDECTSLTSVIIPNSVKSIGDVAFSYCTHLTNVTVPIGVTNVGSGVFSSCLSLTAISVDAFSPFYSGLDGVLFNKDRTTLVECPAGKAGGYTIPDSVTTVGNKAFSGCTSLTSITIPNTVTRIGNSAFEHCFLTSIPIPNSVTSIGNYAFGYSSLTNMTIPSSVTNIGMGPFLRCWSLRAITVDPLNPNYCSLDGALFNKNQTMLIQWPGGRAGGYTIPEGVTSIGDWAFGGTPTLTSIIIPNTVTSIGADAFDLCESLTAVYFRGNAPETVHNAMYGSPATMYYLPGTTGWGATFAGRATAQWRLPYPVILTTTPSFGIQANQFGFRVSWATNATVVVEASTSLANSIWSPLRTNALSGGWFYFGDGEWTNYPARFYRVRRW